VVQKKDLASNQGLGTRFAALQMLRSIIKFLKITFGLSAFRSICNAAAIIPLRAPQHYKCSGILRLKVKFTIYPIHCFAHTLRSICNAAAFILQSYRSNF